MDIILITFAYIRLNGREKAYNDLDNDHAGYDMISVYNHDIMILYYSTFISF